MPDEKKYMKTKVAKPQSGRDKPLPETDFEASFRAYNPGVVMDGGRSWAENKRKEQALNPSYPELVVMSGVAAIKGARTAATIKEPAKFSMKRAASAFGVDLGIDAAVDYDRDKRRK